MKAWYREMGLGSKSGSPLLMYRLYRSPIVPSSRWMIRLYVQAMAEAGIEASAPSSSEVVLNREPPDCEEDPGLRYLADQDRPGQLRRAPIEKRELLVGVHQRLILVELGVDGLGDDLGRLRRSPVPPGA
jgi:hypothetical protein